MVSRHPTTSLRTGSRTQDSESLLGVQQINADVIQAKTFPDQIHSSGKQHAQVEGADGCPSDLGRGLDLHGIAMEGVLQRRSDAFLLFEDVVFVGPRITQYNTVMKAHNEVYEIRSKGTFLLQDTTAQNLPNSQDNLISNTGST
jgi:hypothetical protein